MLIKPKEFEFFNESCRNGEVLPSVNNRKGATWMEAGIGKTGYNHNLPPGSRTCTNQGLLFEGTWTASSKHRGGVNALFADGHVRFVRDSISTSLWRAIGTRGSGEQVDDASL